MKKFNDLLTNLILVLIFLLPIIIVITCIIGWIYCLINYGGKPITEVPAWAWWFMNSGK